MTTRIGITETATSHTVRIIQKATEDLSLASSASIMNGDIFAVKLGRVVADGSTYTLYLKNTYKLYSYTTVLGAKKNVAIYDCVPVPWDATPEQLFEAFEKGQRFNVLMPKEFTCPECEGRGDVPEKKGAFTTRKKCSRCNGSKTIELPALYNITR